MRSRRFLGIPTPAFGILLVLVLIIMILLNVLAWSGAISFKETIFTSVTILALFIALFALAEAITARRDYFLPVLVVRDDFQHDSNDQTCLCYIDNCGNGVALDIKVSVTGVEKILKRKMMKPREVSKHGIFIVRFKLYESKLFTQIVSKPKLKIDYLDIFGRKITTIYKLRQEKYSQINFRPVIDLESFEFKKE